jgi:hypothetical protein
VSEVGSVLYVLIILGVVAIVSCLFDPTDCLFVAFKSVGYRTTCEVK